MAEPTICRLCLNQRPLRNSHIFPEFLYRPLYDQKSRALKLEPDRIGTTQIQKGLRERLLCEDCEQHLSKFEKYFADAWYNPPKLPRAVTSDKLIELSGLDYAKFKLFHLSNLWRASVSSLAVFQGANLGPHEERIRGMIQRSDPGSSSEYPILGAAMTGPASSDLAAPTIMTPIPHRIEGLNLYLYAFGSCSWQLYISNHRPLATRQFALSEAGSMILLVTDMTEHGPIDKFMRAKVLEARDASPDRTRR